MLPTNYLPTDGLKNAAEVQAWLDQNYSVLEDGGFHYLGGEPNTQPASEWDVADIRVLIVRLSTYDAMDGSMTHSLLAQCVRREAAKLGKHAFTDFAFLPPRKDYDLFMKNKISVMVPVITKRQVKEFDLILVSHSLHLEQVNWPRMLIKSGIPLFKPARMKRDDIPLILWGGSHSIADEPTHGSIDDSGENYGLTDAVVVGDGEPAVRKLIQIWFNQGPFDSSSESKHRYLRECHDRQVPGFYEPDKYEHTYEDGRLVDIRPTEEYVAFPVKKAKVWNLDSEPTLEERVQWYSVSLGGTADVEIARGCGAHCSFCVSKDAPVHTQRGLIRLGDVKVGDSVWGEKGFEQVTATFDRGRKATLKFTLKGGQALPDVTPDHEFYVFQDGELVPREARLFQPGDTILLDGRPKFLNTPDQFSRDWMEFLGYLIGDGTYNTGFSLFADARDISVRTRIEYWMSQFNLYFTFRVKQRNTVEYVIHSESQELVRRLLRFYSHSTAREKVLPDYAFTLNQRETAALLRGLFTADGTVGVGGKDLSFKSASKQLRDQVAMLLMRFGYQLSFSDEGEADFRVFIRTCEDRARFGQEIGFFSDMKNVRLEEAPKRSTEKGGARFLDGVGKLADLSKVGIDPWARWKTRIDRISPSVSYHLHTLGALTATLNEKLSIYSSLVIEKIELSESDVCDITVEPSHKFVLANGILVANCQEASISRPYRERSLQKVKEAAWKSRYYQGALEINLFSFVWNQYSRIYELAQHLLEKFGRCNLISNRLDMQSEDANMAKLIRVLGGLHTTVGLEGISERMRNYLNKNLSHQQVLDGCRNIFNGGITELKMFMISTGLETQEDTDEFCSLLDDIIAIRNELNSTATVRISFTPLFHCAKTALQYGQSMTMAKLDERTLDPIVSKCRELGIGFRTSTKRSEVFLVQLTEQGDRRLTPLYVKASIDDGFIYYGFISKDIQEVWQARMAEMGLDPNYYIGEKSKDYVFPWDGINTGLSNQYLWEVYQEVRAFQEREYCVATLSKRGSCTSCQACETPLQISQLTNRRMNDPVADLTPFIRPLTKASHIRFKIYVDDRFRTVPKKFFNLSLGRALCQASDFFMDHYNQVISNSRQGAASDGAHDWTYGEMLVDVSVDAPIKEETVRALIPEINKRMVGWRILDVRVVRDMESLNAACELALYEIDIPVTQMSYYDLDRRVDSYFSSKNVKIKKRVQAGRNIFKTEVVDLDKSEVVAVEAFFTGESENRVVFSANAKLNPYFLLESLLGGRAHNYRKYPVICRGYYKMGERNASADIFSVLMGGSNLCSDCGSSIENEVFSGEIYKSEFGKSLCLSCDISRQPVAPPKPVVDQQTQVSA